MVATLPGVPESEVMNGKDRFSGPQLTDCTHRSMETSNGRYWYTALRYDRTAKTAQIAADAASQRRRRNWAIPVGSSSDLFVGGGDPATGAAFRGAGSNLPPSPRAAGARARPRTR